MVAGLIWSPRALDDLDDILEYIAKESPKYASMVGKRMFARADLLPDNPKQGRRVPEHEGDIEYREVFVHRWRVIYELAHDRVTIVTIIHGARILENIDPL